MQEVIITIIVIPATKVGGEMELLSGSELSEMGNVILEDVFAAVVTLLGGLGKEPGHLAFHLLLARAAHATGLIIDRRITKPDVLHDVFEAPRVDVGSHLGLGEIEDGKSDTAEEVD